MVNRILLGIWLLFTLLLLLPQPASGQEQPPNLYLPIIITFPAHSNSLILIPEGRFKMGCDETLSGHICYPNELPLHTVDLSAFEIQKFEVMNGEYKQCVDAGSCTPPGRTYTRTQTYYYGNPAYGNYPVLYLTWYQVSDYCSWIEMRLPTEAEWEKPPAIAMTPAFTPGATRP